MKEQRFVKEVEYNWDDYEHGFTPILVSLLVLFIGIVTFISGDYITSSYAFMLTIIVNILAFLINVCFIRRVYWRKE